MKTSESTDHEKAEKSFEIKAKDNVIFFNTLNKVDNDQQTLIQAKLVEKKILKIFSDNPKQKYSIIVTMYKGNHTTSMPDEALQIYRNLLKNKQLSKVAIVGGNAIIRAVVGFLARIVGKYEVFRWYETPEDAKKWINEKSNKKPQVSTQYLF